ncbi:diguanylate cyclase (GGDEF)-like protein [Malaciobacter marinus]|uniref:diguanylate cyclase n=1 Tax=Malaciobacter marinus TaxID=505249 RepID=A0AB36ZYU9_9BACT|nr:diguanylate cyclase [Malaciobacter marinus]PPK62144.1 diguanylate cyclase (GGDEF)-like protein [Malaciobacter marinus]
MKKIILKKLLFRNYLKTSLISILFIGSLLICAYFWTNKNIIDSSKDFLLKDANENTTKLINKEISTLRIKLHEVTSLLKILKAEHEFFFENIDKINYIEKEKIDINYNKNGAYYKQQDNGGSSVVFLSKEKLTNKMKEKIFKTENFDRSFKTIIEENPSIMAVYFNSYDNMNRYYPFIKDIYKVFSSDINLKDYNFYNQATLKENPMKSIVWTKPYFDPVKKEWIISCIVPIYNNGFLEGVTGIDVSLDSFTKNFFDFNLPYETLSMIIDKSGTILAMSKGLDNILNIKESKIKDKNRQINTTILRPSEFNITNHKVFEKLFTKNFYLKNSDSRIVIKNKEYIGFVNEIRINDWKVISLLPVQNLLSSVENLEEKHLKIGYFLISFIIVFYLLFLIFLYYKSKQFVESINISLRDMVRFTQKLVTNKPVDKVPFSGIYEIDKLAKNFNNLSLELTQRTQKLIQTEALKIANEKLANTDALTGIYNRRFLDDFAREFNCKPTTLSVVLFDIDDFKQINDNFGHDIGDKVIKKLINIIDTSVRQSDCIIRLGGDEFLLLLKDTKQKDAYIVVEKILNKIEENNKKENNNIVFNVSFGVCEYSSHHKSVNELIVEADKIMYKNKKSTK